MEEIKHILAQKSSVLKEMIKCYMVLNKIEEIDLENQITIKEHFQFLNQKSKLVQRLDLQFLSCYEAILRRYKVSVVSDLPENILKAFKPVQSQIQLIQDLESILEQEAMDVSRLEQKLKKYEHFRSASKAYGHK
jgi:predicted  nucleic acid-binding Zn-ribbon protein